MSDLCIGTFDHVKCIWIYRSFGITGMLRCGNSIDRSGDYVKDYEKIYKKLKNINQQMILSDLLLTCIIHTFRIG